jgi:predicted nucleic acid-binding protein
VRRVFADSSLLIAGAGSRSGASRAVLMMAEIRLFQLVVSRQVLDECERNLRRKLPDALPVFAELLAAAAPEVLPDPTDVDVAPFRTLIEAKDAPILAAAVLGGVDRLLTLNTKDFTAAVATAAGIAIQTPGEFVAGLRDLVDRGMSRGDEQP